MLYITLLRGFILGFLKIYVFRILISRKKFRVYYKIHIFEFFFLFSRSPSNHIAHNTLCRNFSFRFFFFKKKLFSQNSRRKKEKKREDCHFSPPRIVKEKKTNSKREKRSPNSSVKMWQKNAAKCRQK